MTVLYHVQQSPTTKVCSHCHIEKPLTAFQIDHKRKDGHKVYCRVCQSELDKVRRETRTFSTIPLTKVCSKCHSKKAIECFYPAVHCKDGYRPDCIECFSAREQAKRIAQKEAKFWANLTQLELLAPTKVCIACHQEKSLDAFYINPHGQYGVMARCRDCAILGAQERAQCNANIPLPVSKTCSKCHINKPLDHFPVSTGYGKYGRASICHICIKIRYMTNRDKYAMSRSKWAKANPLKRREIGMRYEALKLTNQIGEVSYERILERDGYWCHICGQSVKPEDVEFDHVHPLARNGPHSEDNIKIAHGVCNNRKGTKLMSELTEFDRRGP